MSGVDLTVLDGELAVVRLAAGAAVPDRLRPGAGMLAVTATANETSIICDPESAPAGAELSPGWRALVVDGVLDHGLTGVLASIAVPLAAAAVPIFAVSTFDTDYVLVPQSQLDDAVAALRAAGHRLGGAVAAG